MFELRVLGPIELYDGPLRIDLVGVQLAVLTHLFLHANEPVASERLAGDVWNEGQPAVKRLHVAVTRLRKALDASAGTAGCLETVTGGYRLRIPPAARTPSGSARRQLGAGGSSAVSSPRRLVRRC